MLNNQKCKWYNPILYILIQKCAVYALLCKNLAQHRSYAFRRQFWKKKNWSGGLWPLSIGMLNRTWLPEKKILQTKTMWKILLLKECINLHFRTVWSALDWMADFWSACCSSVMRNEILIWLITNYISDNLGQK